MFCPKCGSEVKQGAAFCPKCGNKLQAAAEKPTARPTAKPTAKATPKPEAAAETVEAVKQAAGNLTQNLAQKSQEFARQTPSSLKKGVLALLVVVAAVACFMHKPRLTEAKAQQAVEHFIEENTTYAGHEWRYKECFQYMVSDLTECLSAKLGSALNQLGFGVDEQSVNEVASDIGKQISNYFSSKENQEKFGNQVKAYASCEVGEVQKKKGRVVATVKVRYLDIGQVNYLVTEDTTSLQGMAKLGTKLLLGGGLSGSIANVAGGDISFILDAFFQQAENSSALSACTGEMEFVYDRKAKAWCVTNADDSLLRAYYGMN